MAFDTGNVSFRIFYLPEPYDSSLIDEFAKHAAPPLVSLERDPISGWVTGRHLLDREITEEKCVLGPYISLSSMKAEKKVPEALLRAHCRLEEDAELKAREVETLPRAVRAEIKQRVIDSLLPQMPPTLTSIPVVVDLRNNLLLAGAMSDKQIDALSVAFRSVTGKLPHLLLPETAAAMRKRVNAREFEPVSLSPDTSIDPPAEDTLGMDFLTWLWYMWDIHGGVYKLPDGQEFGLVFEGPLTFYREGAGAHEAVLRKGAPLNSREAAAALLCGKKLRRVKVLIGMNENIYSATLDSEFAIRSLKLPKGEQLDTIGRFQERMLMIETFWSAWLHLFDRFIDLRTDPDQWNDTIDSIRRWITDMSNRLAHQQA